MEQIRITLLMAHRAGLRHIRTVRSNRHDIFRVPPF